MTGLSNCFALLFVLLTWKIVSSEERSHFDDMSTFLQKDMSHKAKDVRPRRHNLPDMKFLLNNLLRFEGNSKHPAEADNFLALSSRSKGTSSDDPLAVLATGFHGSRGKRPSYNDEIPIFANGFPANRGKK